ncbi:MAG: hypothetical protein NVS2B3_17370 [Vulcanimicrobiaceae bacterium]
MITSTTPIVAEDLEALSLPPERRRAFAARSVDAVRVDFLGTTLELSFDDAAAATRYARRYERFRSSAPVEKRAYAVRDGEDTYFWYEDRPAFRWAGARLSSTSIDFLADSVVRREFFGDLGGVFTFHAAAVEVERGAVAIVAPSTGGKTTTAIACARRGMRLYTDEECVTRDGRVHAFPRAINLRSDGIERLLADPPFADGGLRERLAAHRGRAWSCATFYDLFGVAELPPPRPLVATYFLARGGPPATIRPIARGGAVPLLLGAWPRGERTGVERIAEILRMLAAAPPFTLTLGTSDETARAIESAGRA